MPFQPPGQLHQHLLELRVNDQAAVNLLQQLCSLLLAPLPQFVPVLRLLFIDTVQILGKYVLCEL